MSFPPHSKAERISIHAPHARSDGDGYGDYTSVAGFQSTLLMRGATVMRSGKLSARLFQSTLLMRGATQDCRRGSWAVRNFNPRSSCEERPNFINLRCLLHKISIHAPHARSDGFCVCALFAGRVFQSTLLMRGATRCQYTSCSSVSHISIHAPHARSDF